MGSGRQRGGTRGHDLKQCRTGLDAQNAAAEVKTLAERRLGGMLAEMPKHHGGRPSKNRSHDEPGFTPATLSALGIEKNASKRVQKIAAIPQLALDAHFAEVKEAGKELTTAGVLKLANALPALRAELAENEVRDAFTPSERASLGAAIEEAEREEARRRQQEGGRVGGQASGTGSGSLPKANKGDTRDKVGEAVGLSGKSYEQAKKVSGSE